MMKKECKGLKRIFLVLLTAVLLITGLPPVTAEASWYSGDYRYWSQGGSDYKVMRDYGCWIVAQAKLLYETNVERSSSFNPDSYFLWQLNNGQIYSSSNINQKDGGNAPVVYARQKGKNLEYLGYWRADDNQLWYNINAGYYTILRVSGTNTGGLHFVMIDNQKSKATGRLYCYDSFSDRGSVSSQLITRYSIHQGGYVYKANNPQSVNVSYTNVRTNWTDTRNAELAGDIQNPNRAVISEVGAYVWDNKGTCVVNHRESCGRNNSTVYQKLNIVNEAKPSGLKAGTDYTYQFWANVNGRIIYSTKGSFRTKGSSAPAPTKVGKMSTPKAKRLSYTSANMWWDRVSGAAKYQIYIATNKNKKNTYFGYSAGNSVKIINMTPNMKYYFRIVVRDKNNRIIKTMSNPVCVNTEIGSVSGFKVRTTSKNSVSLQWNKKAGVSGYKIYRSTSKYRGYRCIKTVSSGTTRYTNSRLPRRRNYYYRIVPVVKHAGRSYSGSSSTVKARTR